MKDLLKTPEQIALDNKILEFLPNKAALEADVKQAWKIFDSKFKAENFVLTLTNESDRKIFSELNERSIKTFPKFDEELFDDIPYNSDNLTKLLKELNIDLKTAEARYSELGTIRMAPFYSCIAKSQALEKTILDVKKQIYATEEGKALLMRAYDAELKAIDIGQARDLTHIMNKAGEVLLRQQKDLTYVPI